MPGREPIAALPKLPVGANNTVGITIVIVCSSNLEASKFRDTLRGSRGGRRVNRLLSEIQSTMTSALVQTDTDLQVDEGGFCTSHYDCMPLDLFCNSKNECAKCALCAIDAVDAVDGNCPLDLCPKSGGFPECVDPTLIANAGVPCANEAHFEIWQYNQPGNKTWPSIVPSPKQEARFVTPYNRMVGAIVLSQTRRKSGSCRASDPWILSYLSSTANECQSSDVDASPYGLDPTFQRFSDLYDGKNVAQDWYYNSERELNGTGYPRAFFPHSHDPVAAFERVGAASVGQDSSDRTFVLDKAETDLIKDASLVNEARRDRFNLFFDERLSGIQARQMLLFVQDGAWIDEATDSVKVEIITYNSEKDVFAKVKFTFDWETSGRIMWDYELNAFQITLYEGSLGRFRMALEIILIIFFVVNVGLEVWDMIDIALTQRLLDYFTDPFNLLDWIHFTFMGLAIGYRFRYIDLARQIQIKSSYNILLNPTSNMRPFLTNSKEELSFLQFQDQVDYLSTTLTTYTTFAGIASILFVFRQLKSLDFQEHMGLVTRTLTKAFGALAHFFALFALVFVGYGVVGTMLFGHQSEMMSSVSQSCLTLLILLLNFDTTKFFASFVHASEEWVVNLYVWTYVLICFFILLNIFLAILVDAYSEVKKQTEEANGVSTDVLRILMHETKKLTRHPSLFMTNQRFLDLLETLETELDQSVRLNKEQEYKQSKAPTSLIKVDRKLARKAVIVPGGANIMPTDMARILHKTWGNAPEVRDAARLGRARGMSDAMIAMKERDETPSAHSHEQKLEGSILVWDLMERYGSCLQSKQQQRSEEAMQMLELDLAKKQVAAMLEINEIKRLLQPGDADARSIRGIAEYDGLLKVTVVEASNLPSMDIIRGCDAYCILNVDHHPHQVYETEVVMRSYNPRWNEEFQWEINETVSLLDILVVDYDRVTSHDIVGRVTIDIQKLPANKEVDEWHDVILARRKLDKEEHGKRTRVRIKCLRTVIIDPELRSMHPATESLHGENVSSSLGAPGLGSLADMRTNPSQEWESESEVGALREVVRIPSGGGVKHEAILEGLMGNGDEAAAPLEAHVGSGGGGEGSAGWEEVHDGWDEHIHMDVPIEGHVHVTADHVMRIMHMTIEDHVHEGHVHDDIPLAPCRDTNVDRAAAGFSISEANNLSSELASPVRRLTDYGDEPTPPPRRPTPEYPSTSSSLLSHMPPARAQAPNTVPRVSLLDLDPPPAQSASAFSPARTAMSSVHSSHSYSLPTTYGLLSSQMETQMEAVALNTAMPGGQQPEPLQAQSVRVASLEPWTPPRSSQPPAAAVISSSPPMKSKSLEPGSSLEAAGTIKSMSLEPWTPPLKQQEQQQSDVNGGYNLVDAGSIAASQHQPSPWPGPPHESAPLQPWSPPQGQAGLNGGMPAYLDQGMGSQGQAGLNGGMPAYLDQGMGYDGSTDADYHSGGAGRC